jgi:multisubunit Na+/H+ antiporter MnhE subunit
MTPERFRCRRGREHSEMGDGWTSLSLVTAIVLPPLGYTLVFASGYGGNSTGGSEIVWRIGGLVVYAAFLVLLFAALVHVVSLVVTAKRRRRPPTPTR